MVAAMTDSLSLTPRSKRVSWSGMVDNRHNRASLPARGSKPAPGSAVARASSGGQKRLSAPPQIFGNVSGNKASDGSDSPRKGVSSDRLSLTPSASTEGEGSVSPAGFSLGAFTPRARKPSKDTDGRIQVCIRCRPLNAKEVQEGSKFVWSFKSQHVVELTDDGHTATGKTLAFDNVFGPDVDTRTLFATQCKPIVHGALVGYNGTVFAYGQTSSGKTHTLMGNPQTNPGVVILSIDEVFNWISGNTHTEWDTYAAYIEIYNERLTDLLQRDARKGGNLKIIEDKSLGPVVKDLKEIPVLNRQHCLDLIADGEKRRTYASTNMNEHSSRSHTIFRLRVEARTKGDRQKGQCSMTNVASEFLSMQNQLKADRASFYLVDPTTNELFIQAGEITLRIPMSQGIAGAVATTGETINIEDAYMDYRFDSSIDKKTGYRTKSILCMPIRGLDASIVGVVQFINKMQPGSEGFDTNDERLVAGLTQRLGPLISSAQGSATMSTRSQLNLVDLAGSERASKSGARGDILKQAGYINQSLHTLGACIAILSEGKKQHVPFRDSKLTQMLSTSLGGNAKTCLVCAVSPASSNRSETLSTLMFASRAKKIVNHFKRNCRRDQSELVEAYESEIAKLKEQLRASFSFASSAQEAVYNLLGNQVQPEGSIDFTDDFKGTLTNFEANVAEAQTLANKFNCETDTRVVLRSMIASERGEKEDPELLVRVSYKNSSGNSPSASNMRAKWISEEEFYLCLKWLRKQDAIGMLASCAANGQNQHVWNLAEAAIGSSPQPAACRPNVPQVKLDQWKRLGRQASKEVAVVASAGILAGYPAKNNDDNDDCDSSAAVMEPGSFLLPRPGRAEEVDAVPCPPDHSEGDQECVIVDELENAVLGA